MTRTRRFTLVTSLVAVVMVAVAVPVRAQSPLDGFNPGANDDVHALAVQADGKIVVGGLFTALGGGTGVTTRQRIGRLNVDGTVDAFNPGANGTVFALAVQPDGKILVAGSFTMLGGGGTGTTARNFIGRLNADGTLDPTFNPGANSDIFAVAVQPDGKILVGGSFTTLGGGGTGTTPRNRIGRLNADGSLDTAFNPGADNTVNTLGVEADGQIVVGGAFTMLGGGGTGTSTRNRIARLHANGTLDSSFNPGANDVVRASALQSDGRILVGGDFTMLGGGGTGATARNYIGRLNADGSLDSSFNPGANARIQNKALVVQPDGGILVGGDFTMLGGGGTGTTARNRIGRLNPDGSLDTAFSPGANDSVFAVALQPDGKILVGGHFTLLTGADVATRNRIGRLHSDGSIDVDFNPGADGFVRAMAVQPDGKILVGGDFAALGGGTGTMVRNNIGRLNPDGTVDTTFNPGTNGPVRALTVQPDGKILVGGSFTMLGGGGTGTTARNNIGRLNEDGSVDTTFNPGANNFVYGIAVESDGQIIVVGVFTMLGGGGTGATTRNRIGRLNPDGTLDATFNPGANNFVYTVDVQPDGRILVGGDFTGLGGGTGTTTRNRIGRLNQDGTVDMTLNPGATSSVLALALQSDGKIVVGGLFTGLGDGTGTTTRNRIGRINTDGTVDTTFNPGANSIIYSIAVQSDGLVLVGGAFTALGGGTGLATTRNRIGRINADGTVDTTFNPGANDLVYALSVQSDGKVLVGGLFTALGGGTGTTVRNRIGRLTNTTAAIQRLSVTCPGCVKGSGPSVNATLTWALDGAWPDMPRVTFDWSSDGVSYNRAGDGARVSGEWRLTSATGALGQHFYVRARGYYTTAFLNGSGSIVESIRKVTIACPTLSATSLPAGVSGLPYSATLTASGALGLVTFATTSTLPTGVTLSSAGVLAGTPTQTGAFPLTVTATDGSSGCAGSQAYTLTINPQTPLTLTPDKSSLRFAAVTTGAAFVAQTAAQVVRLTQGGTTPGIVTWTAVSNQPWLQVSPAAGSGSATLTVSIVFVGGLPVGSAVSGAITLTLAGASTPAGPIAVTLNLIPNGTSASPFGFVDTPLDNTTGVTGAIPFTGWALDDAEVTRVMVCRAAVAGEVAPVDPNCGGAAQIFVGLGVFIDGARPDVQAAHPSAPLNTRAGWGFMVLTNMLPNQGNGTYQFFMHAEDRDGHTTLLGTRTLTCANASATKPFGAIDTPTQGGPASGAAFLNFGWALTPQPKIIPIDGSTMTVLIDGTPLGPVDYNHERPDIETLFPGFQNTAGSNGGVGFRMIDTTALTNGLHTISWTVTDSLGITEGIGSRFFTVVNGTGAVTAAVEGAASRRVAATAEEIAAAAHDTGPLLGRRGWDLDAPWRWYGVGGAGRAVIRGEEVDRFEVALGEFAGAHYTGHLRAGEAVAPLPAGSQLDAATGHFTWAPGAGFIGRYDLVFVRWEGGRAVVRHEVRIILAPKGSGHVGVQVAIDVPRERQVVDQPFVLAGWAADLDAATGTGIDTLHVWAYPATGGAPVFLGTPALGGVRPDVAAVHGDQLRQAGFALPLQGLIPGTYDLAVFPWSNVTGAFAPPQIVQVTVR